MPPKAMPLADRFWRHVEKTETCWLWRASDRGNGYGQFIIDGHNRRPHQVSWLLTNGQVPDGLELDHICRVTMCVNPAHLEPVTHSVNMRRGVGPPALCAVRTHCPKGHEYDQDNTHVSKKGKRHCRSCDRQNHRERYWRMKGSEKVVCTGNEAIQERLHD